MGKSFHASMAVGTALDGANLCLRNASRLARNAEILLESSGSEAIAYVLWSLGLEEFGKAVLLREQVAGRRPDEVITVSISTDHKDKFAAALRRLPRISEVKFARILHVQSASMDSTVTINDAWNPASQLSVPRGVTGWFEDTADSTVDPTLTLRFSLLYANWDKRRGGWLPLPDEAVPGRSAIGWESVAEELHQALDVLREGILSESA